MPLKPTRSELARSVDAHGGGETAVSVRGETVAERFANFCKRNYDPLRTSPTSAGEPMQNPALRSGRSRLFESDLDAVCDRYEQLCREGAAPEIEDFAAQAEPADREALRSELQAIRAHHQAAPRGGSETERPADTIDSDSGVGLATLGQYKLLEKLGEGGMGAVYRALHTRLRRVVALKVLPPERTHNPEALARFDREMQAVGQLSHPHVVSAHDAGEIAGRHYLAMELVEGMDLSRLAKAAPEMSVAAACELVRQAAIGLQYAHERGMVHRDVKPSNLMLARRGDGPPIVKVLDLGLASLGEADPGFPGLTSTGQVMGTLEYMAPEQALDSRAADIRSDVYSLGATLTKLLTGEAPFSPRTHDTPGKLLVALATLEPPSLGALRSDLPTELVAAVDRMLSRDPAGRLPTPGAVAAALAPFAAGADLAALLDSAAAVAADQSPHDASRAGTSPHLTAASQDTAPTSQPVLSQQPAASPVAAPAADAGAGGWIGWRASLLFGAAPLGLIGIVVALVMFLRTPAGVIRVEINDPAIEVAVKGTQLTVHHGDEQQNLQISPGDKTLIVKRGEFEFETDKLVVREGETVQVKVELLAGEIRVQEGDHVIGRRKLPRQGTAPIHPEPPGDIAHTNQPDLFVNSIGMKLRRVPQGVFWTSRNGEVVPAKTQMTRDFYIGAYEVTQSEWEAVMNYNPSSFSRNGVYSAEVKAVPDDALARYPVDSVSQRDAQRFVRRLNEREKIPGWEYRLPTAQEWEYACRGGTPTRASSQFDYYTQKMSETLTADEANINGALMSLRVGSFRPNALGLYDMHGNVWEWTGSGAGFGWIRRGGSSVDPASSCAAGVWNSISGGVRLSNNGFRVVLAAEEGSDQPPPSPVVAEIRPIPRLDPPPRPTTKAAGASSANSLGMPFVYVAQGRFWISQGGKNAVRGAEVLPFEIGAHEVTQGQWQAVMGANPSFHSRAGEGQELVKELSDEQVASLPVENVNLHDIRKFIEKLNALEEESEWEYRLPTAAEWEFACRGGLGTKEACSLDYCLKAPTNTITKEFANYQNLAVTQPVGQYPANPLGLYDMHGNVSEYCASGQGYGHYHLGGGADDEGPACRVAARDLIGADTRHRCVGLRLVRTPRGEPAEPTVAPAKPRPPAEGKLLEGKVGAVWNGNGLSIRFCWCPPGETRIDRRVLSEPRGFWMAETETTEHQFNRLIADKPWAGKGRVKDGPDYPAVYVTWFEALEFCRELTRRERQAGRLPDGWVFSLPTQDQWEYACRAGTTGTYSFGSVAAELKDYAWFRETASEAGEGYPHPVAMKKPNPWGLYDVHGNVWEWTRHRPATDRLDGPDPEITAPTGTRDFRGGGWFDPASACGSAFRNRNAPSWRDNYLGFRVALFPPANGK